jgi:hypothetical protein
LLLAAVAAVATPLELAESVVDSSQVKESATVAEMELMATVLVLEDHKHTEMLLVPAALLQHLHLVAEAAATGEVGLQVDPRNLLELQQAATPVAAVALATQRQKLRCQSILGDIKAVPVL